MWVPNGFVPVAYLHVSQGLKKQAGSCDQRRKTHMIICGKRMREPT